MLDDTADLETLDILDAARRPNLRSQLMEALSDRIMREIGFGLYQKMRQSVQLLSCINGVISLESALSSLPDVMLAGAADMRPLRGQLVVAVEGDLIGAVVDGMCGATTCEYFERTDLSTMETRVGKQIIDLAMATIADVLSNMVSLNLKVQQYDKTISAMFGTANSQDWMISTTGLFESPLGIGAIKLIAPYAGFEPLETAISSQAGVIGPRSEDKRWAGALTRHSDTMTIALRFEIARINMTIGMFQALRPGQILPFPLWPHAIAMAGNVDLFQADYGQSQGFFCCRPRQMQTGMDAARPTQGVEPDAPADRDIFAIDRLQPLPPAQETAGGGLVERLPVKLSVELGRTTMTLQALNALRDGQVVLLDQRVGDALGIFANGQRLASGEVVLVGHNQYGIRVTSLGPEPGINPS
jgi:flagellar motor switch protein FliM